MNHTATKHGRAFRFRWAIALSCALLALAGSLLAPEAAWAQTIEFENGASADMADDGTITGTCRTVVHFVPGSMDDVDYFEVYMPDGQVVSGYCIDYGLVAPIDDSYPFTATPNGDGTYTVTVNSENATWGVHIDGSTVLVSRAQRVGDITWTPRIVLNGAIALAKTSAVPEVSDGNPNYSLEGAVYGVYESSEAAGSRFVGDALHIYTTDSDGMWESGQDYRAGTYYVAELSAPAGYAIDDGVYEVEVTAGDTVWVNGGSGSTRDSAASGVSGVVDMPMNNPVELWAVKIDSQTQDGSAQGGAALAGAQFTVRYYDGYYEEGALPEEATRTWVVEADGQGKVIASDANLVSGDELYHLPDGRVTIPLGTVTISETTPPEGYLPGDGRVVLAHVRASENGEAYVDAYEAPVFSNEVMRGGVIVGKIDRQHGAYLPQGAAQLEGATFAVVTCSPQPVIVNGTTFESGETVMTMESELDEDGRAVARTDAACLPYGSYVIYELESSRGYLHDDVSKAWRKAFSITKDGQVVDLTDPADAAANLVIRGDLSFSKVDGASAKRMAYVPFLVTSQTTGEQHVIVTDGNGMASTASSWAAHSANTNANDAAVTLGDGGCEVDENMLDPEAGVWFSGRADAECAADDGLGALPFDTYDVTELRVSGNEGYDLVSFSITITRNGRELDLGTVDDQGVPTPDEPEEPEEPEQPEEPEEPEQPERPQEPEAPQEPAPSEQPAEHLPKTGDSPLAFLLILVPAGAIGLIGAALSVRKLEREPMISIERGKPRN